MKKNFSKNAFSLLETSIVILIIGIIIGGVSQSNKLFRKMRLNTARSITQSSAPNSIEDIYFWLDATANDATDITDPEDGDMVALWKDFNPQKNSSRINFYQSVSNNYKPLFKKSVINGLPAISFDGIDDNLINGGSKTSDFISADNGFTIFFVANGHSGLVFFSFDDHGSNRLNVALSTNITPNKQVRFDYPNTSWIEVGSTPIIDKPMILTIYSDSTTKKIRINGLLDSSQSNTTRMAEIATNIVLGSYSNTAWFGSCKIDIGEIILFNRSLNDNEVRDIEKYLSKKWRIGSIS